VIEDLSGQERERYAAQIERIGADAQERLKRARAIVIGARAAGSTAAAHLCSCGVGYVAVVDGGATSRADLVGQSVLYTPDVGANRAEAVAAKLRVLNTHVHTDSYPVDIEEANATAILTGHDVAVDCAGGSALADACRAAGVELVVARGPAAADGLAAAAAVLELLVAPTREEAPA
jgi:molybdopterin/thiamine biosynthesis adenylyltransferase